MSAILDKIMWGKAFVYMTIFGTYFFSFSDVSLLESLFVAIIFTIGGYFLTDLWVLPRAGNIAATAVDIGYTAAFLGIGSTIAMWHLSVAGFWTILATVVFIEALTHQYLQRTAPRVKPSN